MKKPLTVFFLTSVFAASLPAQRPSPDPARGVQRRVNMLATVLSLTSNQQTEATTIFTNAGASEAVAFSGIRAARQSLAEAVMKNDTAIIDQASTTIGNLTAQLTSTESKADAAFYQILTPDQQTKFNQLKSQRGPMRPSFR